MTAEKICLTIATRNRHKVGELVRLLGDRFEVRDLETFPEVPLIEETGSTFAENAALKGRAVSTLVAGLVVADDSGLEVDALGGAPGVYSARYAGEHATDAENVARLLRELKGANAWQMNAAPAARFRCVLALAKSGEILGIFEGAIEGTVIDHARGDEGFGYDPVFVPEGFARTFAELGSSEKNRISHRALATEQLKAALVRELA